MADVLAITSIAPASWNPRTVVDEAGLAALTESVRVQGVIEPIIVRPLTKRAGAHRYEVVAGSRRLAAAQAAGLDDVPVVVREVNDVQAAEIAMAENIQDEAMGPLDEARGYERLIDGGAASMAVVAGRLGVKVSRIRKRMRLLDLDQVVQEALSAGRITVAHADLLTRVPRELQMDGLAKCFYSLWRDEERSEPAPVSDLESWISKRVNLALDEVIAEDYFPQLVEDAPAPLPSLIRLSDSHFVNDDLGGRGHGLIGANRWCSIGPETWGGEVPSCEHVQDGVVVHGGPWRIVRVCAKPGCSVHRPRRAPASDDDGGDAGLSEEARAERERQQKAEERWREQERREAESRRRWDEEREGVVRAFLEHCADLPVTVDLVRISDALAEGVEFCQEILGKDWELEEARIGQVIAAATVRRRAWSREQFLAGVKPFGWKAPRRKAQPKKGAAKKGARRRPAKSDGEAAAS